jgi:hypothetical protein
MPKCNSDGAHRPTVRLRVPPPMLGALDAVVTRTGQTRSEVIRSLLAAGLQRIALWPPAGDAHGEAHGA